jgi:hypothetical protein
MSVRRFTISVSQELADALDDLQQRRGDERSRLVETLLRENPLIRGAIERQRDDPLVPGTKKGRDLEKVRALGRAAARNWARKEKEGKVRVLGP